jgi:phenylpropionate dioxygenase-like ring-hydroxylating dioxygenase large terminal subunit
MFLQNAWYVAAWETEIGDGPFARTILNEPVVLFRTPVGVVALEDRCCHRALPLSMGQVEGAHIQCGYHGLEFDASGACVKVPGQSKIPPGAQVRSYPVIQRWGWVWIWTGDPAKADASLLPDWWWLDDPDWKTIPGRGGAPMPVEANYLLISDNLFDISHLTYVHASSIGNDSIVDFPVKTERYDRGIKMTRLVPNRPAAPFYQKAGQFEANVDRFLVTESDMPGYIVNHAGTYKLGADAQPGEVTEDIGVEMKVMNLPTPETETSTHYFYAHARHFKIDAPDWDEIYRTQFTAVFEEDQVILNAQQASMSKAADTAEIDVNSDAPNIQVRALMDRLIAEEQGTAPKERQYA